VPIGYCGDLLNTAFVYGLYAPGPG